MIDPLVEQVVSLTDAAKLLPARRGGKRPHVSCIYRWTATGCKGVILESIQIGGTRCTSREALVRFFDRLTICEHPIELPIRSLAERQKDCAAAAKELERMGVH